MMKRSIVLGPEEARRREAESERLRSLCQRRFGFPLVVFRQNPVSLVGLILVLAMLIVAIIGPIVAPYNPDATNPRARMQPPSSEHLFGTDTYGRDLFSRVLAGARVDFLIAIASIGLAFLIGSLIGVVAGYFGGPSDHLLMRAMDVMQSFPPFILGMGLAAAMGPGIRNLIIVITVIMVPGFARMVRSRVVTLRELSFIDAAKSSSVPTRKILFVYLLPNSMGPIIVSAALNMSYAMLDAAGLSFIGLGVRPPQAEWGMMISEGMNNLLAGQWWVSLFPGLALFVSVLGFNLLADGLRDIMDPRMRR
jgi:peptide/nickel transport system permease protein